MRTVFYWLLLIVIAQSSCNSGVPTTEKNLDGPNINTLILDYFRIDSVEQIFSGNNPQGASEMVVGSSISISSADIDLINFSWPNMSGYFLHVKEIGKVYFVNHVNSYYYPLIKPFKISSGFSTSARENGFATNLVNERIAQSEGIGFSNFVVVNNLIGLEQYLNEEYVSTSAPIGLISELIDGHYEMLGGEKFNSYESVVAWYKLQTGLLDEYDHSRKDYVKQVVEMTFEAINRVLSEHDDPILEVPQLYYNFGKFICAVKVVKTSMVRGEVRGSETNRYQIVEEIIPSPVTVMSVSSLD